MQRGAPGNPGLSPNDRRCFIVRRILPETPGPETEVQHDTGPSGRSVVTMITGLTLI